MEDKQEIKGLTKNNRGIFASPAVRHTLSKVHNMSNSNKKVLVPELQRALAVENIAAKFVATGNHDDMIQGLRKLSSVSANMAKTDNWCFHPSCRGKKKFASHTWENCFRNRKSAHYKQQASNRKDATERQTKFNSKTNLTSFMMEDIAKTSNYHTRICTPTVWRISRK